MGHSDYSFVFIATVRARIQARLADRVGLNIPAPDGWLLTIERPPAEIEQLIDPLIGIGHRPAFVAHHQCIRQHLQDGAGLSLPKSEQLGVGLYAVAFPLQGLDLLLCVVDDPGESLEIKPGSPLGYRSICGVSPVFGISSRSWLIWRSGRISRRSDR